MSMEQFTKCVNYSFVFSNEYISPRSWQTVASPCCSHVFGCAAVYKLSYVLHFCTVFLTFCSCFVTFRRAWWRMNVRIQVKRPSHSSTSSSPGLVLKATASTPLGSPAYQRQSSNQDTERPKSLRGAPSASDFSSMY